MTKHEHPLEQSGHSGGRLEVPEVGLYRSDRQGVAGVAPSGEHPADCARLLRVAGRGTRAVGLDVGELPGIHSGAGVCAPEELLLGVGIGHRESTGTPIGVDGGAEDQGVDGIAVPACLRERFEEYECAAFCAYIAVARSIESPATAARREHPGLREADEVERRHEDVDAAGERSRRIASPDPEAGLMQGDE